MPYSSFDFQFIADAVTRSDKIVFAFDADRNEVLFVNPAFEEVWNTTVSDLSEDPQRLIKTVHPEDAEYLKKVYRDLLAGEKKGDIEFRITRGNNDHRWLIANVQMVHDEQQNRRIITGLIEDITDWKDQEMNLQKFAAKKNAILEILSHDLAGPLNNIKGLAGLLSKEIQQQDQPKLKEIVDMIEETTDRSIHLIREFVKHEFMTSENTAMVRERVNLVTQMEEIMSQYKESERSISKTFILNSNRDKIYVNIDSFKFSQVINNLISNSVKFSHDGGIITLTLEDRENSVMISLADNGIGIPEKYHDTLFERFPKARRPGLKGEPSTGLGMSIIKNIVEWHNGKIWFKSKENEGSTFYIEIPKS